jgi:hypothetical protein
MLFKQAGEWRNRERQGCLWSDLIFGSIYGPASCKPPLLQPVGSQKDMGVHEPMLMSSTDCYPSTIHGDSDF